MVDEKSSIKDWAHSCCGNSQHVANILVHSMNRFLQRHGCSFLADPAPGWLGLVRIHRAAAVLDSNGVVHSIEMLPILDIQEFERNQLERGLVLDSAQWDDNAALFTQVPPPRRTQQEPARLDWNGNECIRRLPDQMWQLELLVNKDLLRHPGADNVLCSPLRETNNGHRHFLPEVSLQTTRLIRDIQAKNAAASLDCFRDLLDQDKMEALSSAHANSVGSYNWLAGQQRSGCNKALARLRTQAALAYPVAWSFLTQPVGVVQQAIEDSLPLSPVLASVLGVSESIVRKLNGLTAQGAKISVPSTQDAVDLASKVARMPPGKVPQTQQGWQAYLCALDACNAAARLLADSRAGDRLLASASGRWDGMNVEDMHQCSLGLGDMVADLHANLLGPVASLSGLDHWSEYQSIEILLGSRGLEQLAASSLWWHNEQGHIHQLLANTFPPDKDLNKTRSWAPLHGSLAWIAANGLQVHALCSENQLVAEHNLMGHCVNQYSGRCLVDGSHILSIRQDGERVPLATAEINGCELLEIAGTYSDVPDSYLTRLPPSVIQFKAARNAVPDTKAWQALWSYIGAILTGGLELDKEGLKNGLARRKASYEKYGGRNALACYDHSREQSVMEAWKLYSKALPKALAKRGPRALAEISQKPVLERNV